MGTTSDKPGCRPYKPLAFIVIIILQVVMLLLLCDVIPTPSDVIIIADDGKTERIKDKQTEGQGQGQGHEAEDTEITKSYFGRTKHGEKIYKYKFVNTNKLELEILNLGGIIYSVRCPCRHGHLRDVIVGFDNITEYIEGGNRPYFGALIGRVANRISNSSFTLDGATYNLPNNDGDHSLHGGKKGWDKAIWRAEQHSDHVALYHTSPDGDEGYPGEVNVKVTYQLTNENEVVINFTATTNKKTPINLTSHPYFNLAGGAHANSTILDHEFSIHADKYVVNDDQLIPTGEIASVCCTLYDFREPVLLGDRVYNVTGGPVPGYDASWVVRGPTGRKLAAKAYHPHSGRVLEVYTNQPGLQFYTGNFLNITCAKGCHSYRQHSAFCMETQNFPDAINKRDNNHHMGVIHEPFPDSVLIPGDTYIHQVWYKFTTAGKHH